MKHFSLLLSFDIIVSLIHSIFDNFSRFSFLNCSFIIGMIYFLFGAMCFVWEKGFFDITLYSFNKISQEIQKKRGLLCNDTEITVEDYINKEKKFFLTYNLLACGFFISIVCIGISFVAIS